jgi:hypothetical protein
MRPTWEHSAVAALTTVVTAGLLLLPGRVLGPDRTVGLALQLSPIATRQTVEAAPPQPAHVPPRQSPRPSLRPSPAQLASVVVPARPAVASRHVVTHKAAPQHQPVSAVRPLRPSPRIPLDPAPVAPPALPPAAPAPAPGSVPAVVTPDPEPAAPTTRVLSGSLAPVVEGTPPAAADETNGNSSHNDTKAGGDNGEGNNNDNGNANGNDNGHGNEGGQCDDSGHGPGSGSDKNSGKQ